MPIYFGSLEFIRFAWRFFRMDSFVLSETLKYLYMIFAEPSDMLFDPDNYVLTTEAHFLPLNIADVGVNENKVVFKCLLECLFVVRIEDLLLNTFLGFFKIFYNKTLFFYLVATANVD